MKHWIAYERVNGTRDNPDAYIVVMAETVAEAEQQIVNALRFKIPRASDAITARLLTLTGSVPCELPADDPRAERVVHPITDYDIQGFD
jgi:hypothetical protein